MLMYPAYLAIKERLAGTQTPIFFYIEQYQKGKDNTSYNVPAIYIEMPKNNSIDFFPTKRMVAKDVLIKVHYISYAPFKNHDNAAQENAINLHNAKLIEIDLLLNGWNAFDTAGRILTQQLIPASSSLLNFMEKSVVSTIDYKTELFSSHLQG